MKRQLSMVFVSVLIAGCVALVSVSLGIEVVAQETDNDITAFDFSASADKYATAHQAGWIVRIWDASDDQLLHTVQVPDFRNRATTVASIDSLVFSPAGDLLAIGPWGDIPGLLLVVDTFTGETLLEISDMPPVTAIEWSPDGEYLAGFYDYSPLTEPESFGDLEHFIALWDIETGEELKQAMSGVSPESLDWSSSGDRIIFPDSAQGIVTWDVANWQTLATLPAEEVVSVAWSSEEKAVFASTGADGVVRIWDGNTGALLREISAGSVDEWLQRIFWSQDGNWIGITTAHSLRVWNADTGVSVFTYEAAMQIQGSALLADGRIVLASGHAVEYLETSIPIAVPEPSTASGAAVSAAEG